MKLGLDPVHFGIMIVVNMEVGRCHPPVGLNLYVASGITKMGITELAIAVRQWLLTMLVFLVVRHLLARAVDLGAEDIWHDVKRWAPRSCWRYRSNRGRLGRRCRHGSSIPRQCCSSCPTGRYPARYRS